MDEEQAINYIGKTVYVVDFHEDWIESKVVKSLDEVSNNPAYQYHLIDTDGKRLLDFYDTYEKAYDKLVWWCEQRVDVEVKRLNKVIMEGGQINVEIV